MRLPTTGPSLVQGNSAFLALQLNVALHFRAAQGHHKDLAGASVKKYGRDDVSPQLRCQRAVLRAVCVAFQKKHPYQIVFCVQLVSWLTLRVTLMK